MKSLKNKTYSTKSDTPNGSLRPVLVSVGPPIFFALHYLSFARIKLESPILLWFSLHWVWSMGSHNDVMRYLMIEKIQ